MSLADEVLSRWAPIMKSVELRPGEKGRFEVTLDGALVFSKEALKRHPQPGEVVELFEASLGDPPKWRK